jgi:hypothetical protein
MTTPFNRINYFSTTVRKILLIICHACKVPPDGMVTADASDDPDDPQTKVKLPDTFEVTGKDILVIESSRHGFVTGSPTYTKDSSGKQIPTAPDAIKLLETMSNATTYQDVIDRFSETILPSDHTRRDPNKYYMLSARSKGIARLSPLMMHESLLFRDGGDYYHNSDSSSQGIFILDLGTKEWMEIPHVFGLTDITLLPPESLGLDSKTFRKVGGTSKYIGKYRSISKKYISLSEILNNPVIDDGSAVIIVACKSICGTPDTETLHHGVHDSRLFPMLAKRNPSLRLKNLKRTFSKDLDGLKKEIRSPYDRQDDDDDDDNVIPRVRARHDSDDEDDGDEVSSKPSKGGSKRKTTMKKTKFKHRKRPYINKKNKKRSSKKRPQTKKRKALY